MIPDNTSAAHQKEYSRSCTKNGALPGPHMLSSNKVQCPYLYMVLAIPMIPTKAPTIHMVSFDKISPLKGLGEIF